MSPQLAIYLLWILWLASWIIAAFWSRPTEKRPHWKQNLTQRLIVTIGAVLLLGFYAPHRLPLHRLWLLTPVWGWLMVLAVAIGFAFTWWARIHLGRLWSSDVARKADHHVVESGPYAIVRHPIYTGIILASFATAADLGTASALAGAAIMTVGWYVKARYEEGFLRAELGPAYDAYAGRVAMLVPFLKL